MGALGGFSWVHSPIVFDREMCHAIYAAWQECSAVILALTSNLPEERTVAFFNYFGGDLNHVKFAPNTPFWTERESRLINILATIGLSQLPDTLASCDRGCRKQDHAAALLRVLLIVPSYQFH